MRCEGDGKGRQQEGWRKEVWGETEGSVLLWRPAKSVWTLRREWFWKSEVGLRPVLYAWMFSTWSWCLTQQHREKGVRRARVNGEGPGREVGRKPSEEEAWEQLAALAPTKQVTMRDGEGKKAHGFAKTALAATMV